jgi:hypothetical protein
MSIQCVHLSPYDDPILMMVSTRDTACVGQGGSRVEISSLQQCARDSSPNRFGGPRVDWKILARILLYIS